MTAYARPIDLKDALKLMADGSWQVLAGGTDLYPAAVGARLTAPVLDISALSDLRKVTLADGLRIGATATWSDIAEMALPPALHGLQQAARQIGARQVQNAGTIGGNLCNASPAADGVPPLLTLDARVELASLRGRRTLALAEFLRGPRKTARAADEMLTAILVPQTALTGSASFLKLGARSHLVISIAMVAARIASSEGKVTEVALAVGACSAVAQRLPLVERGLLGARLPELAQRVTAADVAAALAPIEDVRATADYRVEAAVELVRRAVGGLA